MQRIKNTKGATLLVALLFFIACAVIGSIILAAATVASRRAGTLSSEQQPYYTVSSAARVTKTLLEESSVTFTSTENSSLTLKHTTKLPKEFISLVKKIYSSSSEISEKTISFNVDASNTDLNISDAKIIVDSKYDVTITLKKEIKGHSYSCQVYAPAVITKRSEDITTITWPEAVIKQVEVNTDET